MRESKTSAGTISAIPGQVGTRKSGTPMHVLQKLGGWQTPAMVQRYAHLRMDDLKRYAEQVRMQESQNGYDLATP